MDKEGEIDFKAKLASPLPVNSNILIRFIATVQTAKVPASTTILSDTGRCYDFLI
jgi:hypothetical protein